MAGRISALLDEVRRRNSVREKAHNDITFFHSLDSDGDRLSFLRTLDAMEKAAFIEESLKGRVSKVCAHALHLHKDADGADVDKWYIEGKMKVAGQWYTLLSYPDDFKVDMYHPTHEGTRYPVLYLYFFAWEVEGCPRINGKVFMGHELLSLFDSSNRSVRKLMPQG